MAIVALDAGQVGGRTGGIGEHPARGSKCEGRLSDALGARQQPGMMKLSRRPGGGELFDGPILPENHESKSPRASISRSVTSAGVPDASMSLTRSGSSAAMMWNAA